MKVLFDVNVILDVLLQRMPGATDSQEAWDANHLEQVDGFVAATAITNLYYIARRLAGKPVALKCVRECLAAFSVIPVNDVILKQASDLSSSDF